MGILIDLKQGTKSNFHMKRKLKEMNFLPSESKHGLSFWEWVDKPFYQRNFELQKLLKIKIGEDIPFVYSKW